MLRPLSLCAAALGAWSTAAVATPPAGPAEAAFFSPVASVSYRFLWKTLTWASLAVDTTRPAPHDILEPAYPKALEIRYGIDVSAERFRELSWDTLADAWPAEVIAARHDALSSFFALYRDVERDDVYRLQWTPAGGLTLSLNGEALGATADTEAARMILGIWLGPGAISGRQRDEMLQQWRASLESVAPAAITAPGARRAASSW